MDHYQNILKMLTFQQKFTRTTDLARAILGKDFSNNLNNPFPFSQSLNRKLTSKLYNPFIDFSNYNQLLKTSSAAAGIADHLRKRIIKSQFSLNQIFSQQPMYPSLNFSGFELGSVNQVFNNLTDRIGKLAELSKNEEEYEAIAMVAEEAATLTSTIDENNLVTKHDLKAFEDKMLNFFIENVIPKKWLKISEANWSQLIFFLIGVFISYIAWRYPYQSQGDVSAKQEIQEVQRDSLEKVSLLISKDKISRKLNRNFSLRLNPVFSSRRLYYVKKETVVLVLNTDNAWALVTFIDSSGYPVNGWIPKTLLRKH